MARPVLPHPTDPTLALVQLTRGAFAAISAVDAAAVGERSWCVLSLPSGRYAQSMFKVNGKKRPLTLHRFIARLAGLDLSHDIDHINGNGLDCRRENLRPATRAENLRNTRRRRDSTSGAKGVVWLARRSRWIARIMTDGKTKQIGSYLTVEEAEAARAAALPAHHGEFARQNGVSQ
jgi:hypothetical protein